MIAHKFHLYGTLLSASHECAHDLKVWVLVLWHNVLPLTDGIPSKSFQVDARLGEWLSPDYYEFVTAPPPSNMMIAGAKAELLRPPDPLQGAKVLNPDGTSTLADQESSSRRRSSLSMESLAKFLPEERRNGNTLKAASESQESTDVAKKSLVNPKGYQPPTPTYAPNSGGTVLCMSPRCSPIPRFLPSEKSS